MSMSVSRITTVKLIGPGCLGMQSTNVVERGVVGFGFILEIRRKASVVFVVILWTAPAAAAVTTQAAAETATAAGKYKRRHHQRLHHNRSQCTLLPPVIATAPTEWLIIAVLRNVHFMHFAVSVSNA